MPHPRWHLRFSLGALCLMLIVPFLNPHHYNPIPTFYQEWTAAALGLLAATLLLRRDVLAQLEVPGIALLPLGLGALLLVQFATGQIEFATQALIFALYLLWASLLLTLGRSLRQLLTLDELITPLACAMLTGSILAAVLHGLQLAGSPLGFDFMRPQAVGGGNLGQANHLANYLWLGVASAVYLRIRGKLGKLSFSLLAFVLLTSTSLTGSRSVLLYAAGFVLLAGWAAWRYRQPALRDTFRLLLLLCVATLLLQSAFSLLEIGRTVGATLSGERFYQEVGSTSQRLQLWRTGLVIFAEHPWLGAGVGQFPWDSYVLAGRQAEAIFFGGAEHAHNLLIHLLAEFGIIAALLVLLLGLRWWRGFIQEKWSPGHWWIAAVLLVETIHSQLEYPLWHTFFLGIAALALGAGSTASYRPRTNHTSRMIVALMLVLGGLTLANLGSDYRNLEHALNRPAQNTAFNTMQTLHRESLFSHYVDLIYGYSLTVDREALKDKIIATRRAIRFSPVERCVFNLAYLLELDGQHEEARLAWRRAVATHPGARSEALRQLGKLGEQFPELRLLREEVAQQSAR